MKNISNVRLLWCAIIAVVGAAVLIWACPSEYGKGYSEDQRKNWNEMMEAVENSPSDYWVMLSILSYFTEPESFGEEADLSHYYSPPSSSQKKKRACLKDRDKEFIASAVPLEWSSSQPDAPVWKIGKEEPSQQLPLEGMLTPVLLNLAANGDGDACLELVFRLFDNEESADVFPTSQVVYLTKKYLKRAVELRRPGAEFLLRLLEKRRERHDVFQMRDIKGYDEFSFCLDQGDFMLGKVYLYLSPKRNRMDELGNLAVALDNKAKKGDVAALRNAGHLALMKMERGRRIWNFSYNVYNYQINRMAQSISRDSVEWINEQMERFPEWMRLRAQTMVEMEEWFHERVVSFLWDRTREKFTIPLKKLLTAAEQGDLHAKFLWTRYVIECQQNFSRKDWERHLAYANDLLSAGGVYCSRGVESFPLEIFFYQEQSVRDVDQLARERSEKEYASIFRHAEDGSRVLWMDVEASTNMAEFAENHVYRLFYGRSYPADEEAYACKLIEQAAEEGHPPAMFYYSMMLDQGKGTVKDTAKAWEMLSRAKEWRGGIQGKINDWGSLRFCMAQVVPCAIARFPDALEWQMMDMVSRYGDMPGMTLKEAFASFIEKRGSRLFPLPFDFPAYDNKYRMVQRIQDQFEKRGFNVSDEKK